MNYLAQDNTLELLFRHTVLLLRIPLVVKI